MSLYDTGIRPIIDNYLTEKSKERRNYGDYWSASSAGYCMRKVIFDRLGVPATTEDARKQRVFEAGNVFHKWAQDLTKEAGVSIAQELELQDEDLMIRGHFDDLVLIDGNLVLYDIKTAHSKWFEYAKGRPMSYYNKMQLGTYMYMLRNHKGGDFSSGQYLGKGVDVKQLKEARILKISKDDLRLYEQQLLWSDELETEIKDYWEKLNYDWSLYKLTNKLPPCTCADHENGFLAKEKYNPYFKYGEPCSLKYFEEWKEENAAAKV